MVAFLKGLASLQGRVPDEATRRNRRAAWLRGVEHPAWLKVAHIIAQAVLGGRLNVLNSLRGPHC